MKTDTLSLYEIRTTGFEILIRELGASGRDTFYTAI